MSKNKSSDKLNIAMIGHKRIPSREGGVEIVVEELATRMAAKGHSVTCYNRSGHHVGGVKFDSAKLDEYRGVRIKHAWTIDKRGLAAMTSSFFASVAATFSRYDVVHYHAEGPCAMCFIPKMFGKRIVATIHGLDHKRAKWGRFASWYIMRGEKCAVKHADEIIVLSKGVQDYFTDVYHRRTVLIPNGVSKPKIWPAELIREQYGLGKDEYILFLGRIVPEKGIHYLIDAYKGLNTNKKLVIAGSASDSSAYWDELQKLADALEFEKQGKPEDKEQYKDVIFTGFVQGQILEELYSNAYLYVLPSDLEGMPLSLLEAMSYGNACLTSDIPECADVVCDKGVTFAAGSVGDLREKLVMLCEDVALVDKLKREASEYICGMYNWNDVTERTLELYER